MSYRVELTSPARRTMNKLPPRVQVAVGEFLYGPLAENPHRVGKKLREDPFDRYTARVGVYRVIYRIDDAVRVVSVARVGHRADVYRP